MLVARILGEAWLSGLVSGVMKGTRTFNKSSLILTHGFPLTDESLMTMFRALLFSAGSDTLRKSLVRNVPIPKDATSIVSMRLTVEAAYKLAHI